MPLVLVSERPRLWQNVPGGDGAQAVTDHVAAADPHAVYTTDAEATAIADSRAVAVLSGHVADTDPHSVYTTDSEATTIANARAAAALTSHGQAADPHPAYALDTDLANHASAADPHPVYAFDSDLTAALSAHTAASDPHTQYLTKTAARLSYETAVASAGQSFATGATTVVLFDSELIGSDDVSRSTTGAGTLFTFNRVGVYLFCVNIRIQGGGTAAYTGLNVNTNAPNHPTWSDASVTNGIALYNLSAPILVDQVGRTAQASVYHERGSAVSSTTAGGVRIVRMGGLS